MYKNRAGPRHTQRQGTTAVLERGDRGRGRGDRRVPGRCWTHACGCRARTTPTHSPPRGSLATWTGRAGDTAGAITKFRELLDTQLRVLGPDNPDTLTTRINPANLISRIRGID